MSRLAALVAATVTCVAVAGAQEREGDPRDRAAYWNWYETYPSFNPAVTAGRLQALSRVPRASLRASLIPGPGVQNRFAPLGPFGLVQADGFFFSAPQAEGGRVAAIALHPTNVNIMFAGTANGGVWKTTDGGFTWRPVTDDQCGLTIGAIVIDRDNPNLVYASTGEPFETTSHACGVLRSGDGGETWSRLGASTFDRNRIWALHLASIAGIKVLFAASDNGLWRSQDAGGSWTQVLTATISDVTGHPTNGSIVYAARMGTRGESPVPAGLFRSVDGGLTWTEIFDGQLASQASRIELAVSPARPNSFYAVAGAWSNDALQGVYRWDDGAGLVALPGAGLIFQSQRIDFGRQSDYNLAIAVDPVDANRIYLAGVRAFMSTNGGASFSEMAGNIHVDWHDIVVDPANPHRIVAGNDGGVWVSQDRGASFFSRNAGMSALMFYPGLSAHPTIPGFVLGGMQDNGTVRSGGFGLFEGVTGGDGGYTAIDQNDPNVSWTTCQFSAANGCLWRHIGVTRTTIVAGIGVQDRMAFIPPLYMRPGGVEGVPRLYYGTFRLYLSANLRLSPTSPSFMPGWASTSGDLTKGSGVVTTIADAPSATLTVYAGTSDGNLWVRHVQSIAAWSLVTTGLPDRPVSDIAVDAASNLTAWATFGGFGTGHLFKTTDGGAQWTDVSGGLPDVPHGAVLPIPGTTRVFVGTDIGVYESPTGAPPWTRVPGLPGVRVTDLIYQSRFNLVIAGTYGRGLWSLDIGPQTTVLRGDVDRNGSIDANDALLVQQVLGGQALTSPLTVFPQGDANCDGSVSALDAVVILRHIVGAPTAGACVGTAR